MANKITEEKVIKWAEEYATRMKDFILNDKNAKYNLKARCRRINGLFKFI